MSDDECPHPRPVPEPEVAPDGMLTGRCDVVCADCRATLYRDNRKAKRSPKADPSSRSG